MTKDKKTNADREITNADLLLFSLGELGGCNGFLETEDAPCVRVVAPLPRLDYLDCSQIWISGGLIWTGLDRHETTVGRAPNGCLPRKGKRLIVTSEAIQIRGGRVHTECSKCKEMKPLEETGLRSMPSGDLRNQPQCTLCRNGRPAKEQDVAGTGNAAPRELAQITPLWQRSATRVVVRKGNRELVVRSFELRASKSARR